MNMSLRLVPEDYKKLCRKILDRDGWKCRNCGLRNNLHCHHVVYRSELGPDETWNLVAICQECHDLVHNYKLFIGCAEGNHVGEGGGADGKVIFTKGEQ